MGDHIHAAVSVSDSTNELLAIQARGQANLGGLLQCQLDFKTAIKQSMFIRFSAVPGYTGVELFGADHWHPAIVRLFLVYLSPWTKVTFYVGHASVVEGEFC